jgi:hypothetical protein
MLNALPGLSTKYHIYGAMPCSTSITVCIQVSILLKWLSRHYGGCFCWETLWWSSGKEKEIKTTGAKGVRLYDLHDCHWYTLWFLVVNQWIQTAEGLALIFNHTSCSIVSSVSNDSGQSLLVQVQVQTEMLPIWKSRSSIHPNCRIGYGSKVIS